MAAFWEALSLFHRSSSLAESLRSWLRPYLQVPRSIPVWLLPQICYPISGEEPGALFRAINKGGRIRRVQVTTQAIYNTLRKRAEETGVEESSPHDLRRTFVSDLFDAGADIITVSKMAGHASVQTTARYDRRPEEAKRKAASLLHVPCNRRER